MTTSFNDALLLYDITWYKDTEGQDQPNVRIGLYDTDDEYDGRTYTFENDVGNSMKGVLYSDFENQFGKNSLVGIAEYGSNTFDGVGYKTGVNLITKQQIRDGVFEYKPDIGDIVLLLPEFS